MCQSGVRQNGAWHSGMRQNTIPPCTSTGLGAMLGALLMFIFTIQGKRPTHDCHPPAILSPKQVFPSPHFSANQLKVLKTF